MVAKVYVALLALYLALAPGCSSDGEQKPPATGQPSPTRQSAAVNAPTAQPEGGAASEACRLLTSEDIMAVQGEAVREAKGSEQTRGALAIAQCFYQTASFNKSVSLTLTRKNGAGTEPGGPKEFWERQFGEEEREKEREKERKRGKDGGKRAEGEGEEEGERPAQRVKGIGDEAYWVGNQKVGVLYVLKGDRFLRISIGGAEGQEAKTEKMKELARRALGRL